MTRGVALSVYPVLMYRAWQDAVVVAQLYFVVGTVSALIGLSVPWLTRHVPRRSVYTSGAALFVLSAVLGMVGGKWVTLALLCHVSGTAMVFVCFNAFVLDNLARTEFGRLESLRLMFAGAGWTIGPVLGVWLMGFWPGAPFVIVALASIGLLLAFWLMGVAHGRGSARSVARSAMPWHYLRQFAAQPRLVVGWLLVVLRSCGWWLYTVYLGIYAVQSGLGDQVGGIASSLANAGLFLAPLMMRWVARRSLRHAVRVGFLYAGLLYVVAALFSPWPLVTVTVLLVASYFLVLLDVVAGLPFLLSVRPSQRTEMSAVYSSFRDVSGILSPGLVWVVLLFAPLAGVFAMGGLALLVAWLLAAHLHPDLGLPGARRQRRSGGAVLLP